MVQHSDNEQVQGKIKQVAGKANPARQQISASWSGGVVRDANSCDAVNRRRR